ncbi:phosphate acyltransferase [Raphidocelis subcapitata]|uniref:Tafazzin family protein n=1 Tax=Raphidocelis subcapitata TaxID=307507 RepID=A0A2V0PJY6_9CHLO|nr:phosphate acyltransferase [Raphidocelis subcapitata]|eukprot:GBG00037.1 phosphate acyltransferase [Raphidocelis subcapitata]
MDALLEHDEDILRPPWGAYGRDLTLGVISGAAKVLLRLLNTLAVEPGDLARYRELTMRREPGVGLLTFCNHTSTFDDPGLPSALLPWSLFWTEHAHGKMRWTMCAHDVCFKNELLSQFFANGKTLPVERGSSVHQPVIGTAARLLARGGWLHVFPEGKVQPDGQVGVFRQGIGKLICDARAAAGRDPVVLPYLHSGMGRVVPYLSALPRAGNEVAVVVGEPLDLSAVTCRCNQPGEEQTEVWRDIAAVLREALLQLEARAPPNPNQLEERPGLRETIAARCRSGGRAGGGGGGGDGSGRQENFLRAAAVALAEPCKSFVWHSWCGVLQRPYWTLDQERRQLLFAREHSWPLRTGQAEAWQRWQQHQREQQPQQQFQQQQQQQQQWVPGPSRWLAAWRRRRRLQRDGADGAAAQPAEAPRPPPSRRRAWWSWRPPRRDATQSAPGDAAPRGASAPAWQRAPGLI